MKQKAAIYLRVSTRDQNVDSQRAETLRFAESRGMDFEVFEDKASGRATSRDGLDAMMTRVRKGEFKVVICYKLDRLGRSLPHLAQLIQEFDKLGVAFVVTSQGIDTTEGNPAARLQMHILMAIAEFERSMISERTLAGLDAAKRRGSKMGRPKGSNSIPDARRKKAERILAEDPGISLPKLARAAGVSVGTAWKWKKEIL